MNNLQQCENYKNLIDERIDKYMLDLAINVNSEMFYIERFNVVDVKCEPACYFDIDVAFRMPKWKKRPQHTVVNAMKKFYDNFMSQELKKENVRIHCKSKNSSWACNLDEYTKNYSTDKEALEIIARQQKETHERVYVAKEGQFNCTYCGKAANNDKKVKRKIIFRSSNCYSQFVDEKVNDYCCGQCGAYDQMGHEG